MKVLLVGNYADDGQESMQRFALLLQRGLSEAGHQVRVSRPRPLAGRLYRSRKSFRKWLGYVDKFAVFPSVLATATRWADVVHICDHSNAMYVPRRKVLPIVVTCHDMLAVRGALGEDTNCPASRSGKLLQSWILSGLRRADKLACVSTATSQDVERIVGSDGCSLQVIPNGLNYPYAVLPEATARRRLSEIATVGYRRFVLHVGSNQQRKNREGVIRAFARAARIASIDLVLAGPELPPHLKELVKSLDVADKVIVVVKPTNEDLEVLYNSALVLFYPSRFEGFGWPLIEAQACGCPIICSRCAPFNEVVANTARMRDVDDEDGFATDMVHLARDSQEWKELRAKGLQNAQRFLPETMISAYIALYQDLIRDDQ